MDIIQYAADLVNAIARHGWSVTTLVVAVTALLRVNSIRRMLLKRLPKRFRQEDRLDRIEHKIDAIMKAGGVSWDAHYLNGNQERSATAGTAKNSSSSRVALWPVRIIVLFTQKKKEIYHLSGRYQKMKSKFLSRKFLMALISAALVIANDGLDLGLDSNTIIAFGSIVVGWIIGEAAVDVARKPQGGNDDGLYTSTKDSEGA